MSVFAFRHVPFEGLGYIADALGEHGLDCRIIDLWQDSPEMPDMAAVSGLIFMGGPMSVNDDLPWLRQEERLIRKAAERGVPVLGVCLGAQLIARALGARVYRNRAKEIGWFDIDQHAGAARDPLFRGLPSRATVFHWHGENFDLPSGAELLASSEACAHQAFRCGTNIYGLQFHLEVTPEMIADWCRQDANCGDVRELESPIDPHLHAPRMAALSRTVFGRWCESLRYGTAAKPQGV
jgi:GMP synthase (glutamine-hydrolysing)